MEEILVSIICNTYNQEQYIRDALESFVAQKTNFKFEVLVHDDASTDNTPGIIREYEEKYPDVIKPIYQSENQYSQGIRFSRKYQHPRVQGRYVAFCEGDDYWTDPLKLQKQVDALEKNPDVDICAHTAIQVNAETKKKIRMIRPSRKNTILSVQQVIMGGGDYVATNSLMYRVHLIRDELPRFYDYLALDYSLQIYGSLRGGMLFLDECMSSYRWLAKGSWNCRQKANPKAYENHLKKLVQMLNILDEETNFKYSDVIQCRILIEQQDHKGALSKPYRKVIKYLDSERRFKLKLKAVFPVLLHLKQKILK